MRQFNTTAVNLRAALDDVAARSSTPPRPVARKLQPFAKRLRGLRPRRRPHRQRPRTAIVKPPGRGQRPDRAHPPAGPRSPQIGRAGRWTGTAPRGPGALPGLRATPLRDSARPGLHAARLQPGAAGWFDDFGHSGFPDAFGGIGRISTTFNAFSAGGPGVRVCDAPRGRSAPLGSRSRRRPTSTNAARRGNERPQRCPGPNERGPSATRPAHPGRHRRLRPDRDADRTMRRIAAHHSLCSPAGRRA